MREMGRRRRKRSFWSDCNTTKMHCFHFARFLYGHRVKIHCFFGGLEAAVSNAASKLRQDLLLEKSICFGNFECLFGANARDVLRKLSFVYELTNCVL